jgi:hypothetical protein
MTGVEWFARPLGREGQTGAPGGFEDSCNLAFGRHCAERTDDGCGGGSFPSFDRRSVPTRDERSRYFRWN